MAQKPSTFLFGGDAYIRFFNAATGQWGEKTKYEVEQMSITPQSELLQKLSKGKHTYGQTIASFHMPQSTLFQITFSQQDRRLFAMRLAGSRTDETRAASTVQDLELSVTAVDSWVDLKDRHVESVEITDQAGATTYIEGVDYQLNAAAGMIYILASGAITAGDTLHASYDLPARTYSLTKGAQSYNNIMEISVDGRNLVDNEDIFVEIPRATVSSEEAMEFFGDELMSIPLSGTLEIADGWDCPFTIEHG